MARAWDVEHWRDALVAACRLGEEERARLLVRQPGPRKARALLQAMLEADEGLVRQAAAFGLGELGGAASTRRLEEQLVREEARGDHDGAAVAEAITQALGRLQDTGARAGLLRRLQRMTASAMDPADLCLLSRALWRRRHPELLPAVRRAVETQPSKAPTSLHGLLVLLELSPEALRAWAQDMSVPVELKTEVLTVLSEELPEALLPALRAFISTAHAVLEPSIGAQDSVASYCQELLSLLLRHKEQLLPALASEARAELRDLSRTLVAASARLINCSIRAVVLLQHLGDPEDAALIEAHRPAQPVVAKVYDDAAQVLRGRSLVR